jgi:hypothetical protein
LSGESAATVAVLLGVALFTSLGMVWANRWGRQPVFPRTNEAAGTEETLRTDGEPEP